MFECQRIDESTMPVEHCKLSINQETMTISLSGSTTLRSVVIDKVEAIVRTSPGVSVAAVQQQCNLSREDLCHLALLVADEPDFVLLLQSPEAVEDVCSLLWKVRCTRSESSGKNIKMVRYRLEDPFCLYLSQTGDTIYFKWASSQHQQQQQQPQLAVIPFPHSRLDFLQLHKNKSVMFKLSCQDEYRIELSCDAVTAFSTAFEQSGGSASSNLNIDLHSDSYEKLNGWLQANSSTGLVAIVSDVAITLTEPTGFVLLRISFKAISRQFVVTDKSHSVSGGVGRGGSSSTSSPPIMALSFKKPRTSSSSSSTEDRVNMMGGNNRHREEDENHLLLLSSKYAMDIVNRIKAKGGAHLMATPNSTVSNANGHAQYELPQSFSGATRSASQADHHHNNQPPPQHQQPHIPRIPIGGGGASSSTMAAAAGPNHQDPSNNNNNNSFTSNGSDVHQYQWLQEQQQQQQEPPAMRQPSPSSAAYEVSSGGLQSPGANPPPPDRQSASLGKARHNGGGGGGVVSTQTSPQRAASVPTHDKILSEAEKAALEGDGPMAVLKMRNRELTETVAHREVTIKLLQSRCEMLALESSGGGAPGKQVTVMTPRSTTPRTPRGTTPRNASKSAARQSQSQVAGGGGGSNSSQEVEVLRHYTKLLESALQTERENNYVERIAFLEGQLMEEAQERDVEVLQYAVQESQREVKKKETTIERLQNEIRHMSSAHSKALHDLGIKCNSQIQDFILSYSAQGGGNNNTKTQAFLRSFDDFEDRLNQELTLRTKDLMASNAALIEELRERERMIDSIGQQLAQGGSFDHHVASLVQRKQQFEHNLHNIGRQVDELAQTRNQLRDEIGSLFGKMDGPEGTQLEILRQQVAHLEKMSHVPLVTSRLASLELIAAEHEQQMSSLLEANNRSSELQQQVATLKKQFDQSQTEMRKYKTKLHTTEQKCSQLENEKDEVKTQLTKSNNARVAEAKEHRKQEKYQRERVQELLRKQKSAAIGPKDDSAEVMLFSEIGQQQQQSQRSVEDSVNTSSVSTAAPSTRHSTGPNTPRQGRTMTPRGPPAATTRKQPPQQQQQQRQQQAPPSAQQQQQQVSMSPVPSSPQPHVAKPAIGSPTHFLQQHQQEEEHHQHHHHDPQHVDGERNQRIESLSAAMDIIKAHNPNWVPPEEVQQQHAHATRSRSRSQSSATREGGYPTAGNYRQSSRSVEGSVSVSAVPVDNSFQYNSGHGTVTDTTNAASMMGVVESGGAGGEQGGVATASAQQSSYANGPGSYFSSSGNNQRSESRQRSVSVEKDLEILREKARNLQLEKERSQAEDEVARLQAELVLAKHHAPVPSGSSGGLPGTPRVAGMTPRHHSGGGGARGGIGGVSPAPSSTTGSTRRPRNTTPSSTKPRVHNSGGGAQYSTNPALAQNPEAMVALARERFDKMKQRLNNF